MTLPSPTNAYTTVEDLLKWDENFRAGQVGGQAVIERMQQPGHLHDGTDLDYAFWELRREMLFRSS